MDLQARKLSGFSFETFLRFVRWLVCPQYSFEREAWEKKFTDFGPNRFRGFV